MGVGSLQRFASTGLYRILGPTGGWKRRAVTLGVGTLVAGGLALAGDLKPDTSSLSVQALEIRARAITAFDRKEPARTRFGALEWRGGLVLSAPSASFGGLSGLVLGEDGRSFLAVSDAGTWLRGELTYDGGRLKGVSNAVIGPLRARDGNILSRRRDRDAEAIALEKGTPASGTALIAFEQNDRIGRFPVTDKGVGAPVEYLTMPPEAQAMRMDGLESVAVVAGGKLKGAVVGVAEATDSKGHSKGWVWIKGKPQRFTIAGGGGFNITDVKGLEDGSLLLLERRFRWSEGVKMRLSLVPVSALKPGAVAERRLLAEADMGQEIDNMEGLAVHRDGKGDMIVTLISDDNFNALLQRTVLLQFTLRLDAAVGRTAASSAQSADRR